MTSESTESTVQSRIATWDLLLSLGFVVDPAVISDSKPGLSYDFGILKLEASHVLNQYYIPIVGQRNVKASPRSGQRTKEATERHVFSTSV